ncbi:MAG: NTP transferase domain-containing protein [Candidatus Peribacteraceae bacterium]|nr:NTP transferase domain-containing protein [Candidatus Peribacteraceae bacterium]
MCKGAVLGIVVAMKGVLICGGSGTRLKPLTEITNKSLLPVYDKPLILYPLQVLLDAGIRDIAVISGSEHVDQMAGFLGSGNRFGCQFSYRVQDEARGIAQALGLAESFVDGEDVCAILGDNIYFDNLSRHIRNFKEGAHLFLKEVTDPERFGVASMDGDTVVSIEEKPKHPKTNMAVTGCYVYDKHCFDIIRHLKPSARNELEITDVSGWYAERGLAKATVLTDEWVDAGTFDSLFRAADLVRKHKIDGIVKQVTIKVATDTAPTVKVRA